MRFAFVVLVLLLGGCLGSSEPPAAARDGGSHRTDAASERPLWTNATGRATASPAQPFQQEFPIDVPTGAVEVKVTLTWTPSPLNAFQLTLFDSEGKAIGRGFPEKDGQRSLATDAPPPSGRWKARVTSERALDAPFAVSARVSLLVPDRNTLEDTITLIGQGFAEVNLIMEDQAAFNYSFRTDPATTVAFNIHSHENGKTTYHAEGSYAEHRGSFAAPKRQIYSLLWENKGVGDVKLHYTVEGAFRVHSHSQ